MRHREKAFALEREYEETRLRWNESRSHEERQLLSERLEEIRREEYEIAADDWPEMPIGKTGGEMSSQSIEA